jgi:hypothetical protein
MEAAGVRQTSNSGGRLGFDRQAQLLQGFLSLLILLPQTLLLDSSASTLAGGAQLVQPKLLWRFGFYELKYSHAFIYGAR